jgi:hypothetical protein
MKKVIILAVLSILLTTCKNKKTESARITFNQEILHSSYNLFSFIQIQLILKPIHHSLTIKIIMN